MLGAPDLPEPPMPTRTQQKPFVPPTNKTTGFSEAGAVFAEPTQDTTRFNESLALMRSFGAIESDEARQQVLDLAQRLADHELR